jgi:diguanylate cyclase (GGDEF)-like protein/PAS domain S-box-containing protein
MKTADLARRTVAEAIDDPRTQAELLNAFPVPIWICDASGDCVFVNQAWQDFTGRSFSSDLGKRWESSIHPEDREGMVQAWVQALGLRRPFSHSYRVRRADEAYAWVHDEGLPVNDEHGRFVGYLGTCNDISEQRNAELAARQKEGEIRMLADNVPIHIAYFEAKEELKCLFANKAYARMWGWDEGSIVGRPVREVIGEEGYREISPYIDRVTRGESVTYERSVTDKSGARRVLEVSLLPQRDAAGETLAAFVLIHDITRHRLAEQAIRESEERLRMFAEATRAGIAFHDGGIVSDCNDAVLQLVGYTREEMIGSQIIQYVAPENREEALDHVRTGYDRPYESVILHKDGTRIPVEFEGRLMPFNGKMHRLSVVRDIRRRKENQARIDFLAHHDALTSLPNRALLLDRLEFILANARRRGSQVGLLFIDLDNFKTVNDSLGHSAGDQLLKVVATRIQAALRSGDVVSRHGGDEFLVVLPELEGAQASVPVAEKLLAAVTEPVTLDGHEVSVSPSIGISVFPRDGATADALIKNADAAMYLAKERGRSNYQFFNASLSEVAYRTLELETRLRQALREHEFTIHYQPQMRLATGEVTGVEALIRWPQQNGSWIPPDDFIPVAEQRGLIRSIGGWVLREACRQNVAWQKQGLPPLPVAVNLSTIQFRQRNFVAEVEGVLAETGLDPRYLAFELTEGMLMEDPLELARTLEKLKAIGVKLAIDDFGTGHSSLMHLKRFPIDKLKIDRTFVKDCPGDPDDVAITGAIIDLARNMGITSIAEGVDDKAQFDFLKSRGCDELQGYLFARAMPPDEVAAWLGRPHSGTLTKLQTA